MTKNSSIAEKVLKSSVLLLNKSANGENIDDLLDHLEHDNIRSICTDLLFCYFRNKAFIDYLICHFTGKKGKNTPAKYRILISVALTQSLWQTGIESCVAVDLAVDFAKKKYGKQVSGFINAVLRRCLDSDRDEIKKIMPFHVKSNIPQLLFNRWEMSFGRKKINEFSEIFAEKPLFSFRVTGDIPLDELTETGCKKIELPDWGCEYDFYSIEDIKPILAKNWLKEGKIYIQDPATVSPCSLFKSYGHELVIDMCAAPGGKSLLLNEKIGSGILISADRSFYRQQRTIENLSYSGQEEVFIIVSSAILPPFRLNSADTVLLDVPCTNTGVIRRRPDVLWNFSTRKLNELTQIQKKMLSESAKIVKPGGSIIYSTCSIEEEENCLQIEFFLNQHADFSLEADRQLLPSRIHDGGYGALLRKKL